MAQHNQFSQQGVILTKHGYEQSVVARALGRAGNNPQLKGHIQEIMVKDLRNVRNVLTLNGASTELTKSTTAGTVDLVTTRAGKVIERIQVKDVTSRSGIDKLVKQCADGKYRSAKLIGSEETTQAFNKAAEKVGISKRMSSSGVSSKTTESLAQRAGATGSGTLLGAVGGAAKAGGMAGAAAGAGISLVKGVIRMANGEAELSDVAVDVAKYGAKGAAGGAAAGAAATLAGAGATALVTTLGVTGLAATAATVGAPIVVAMATGYLVTEGAGAIIDAIAESSFVDDMAMLASDAFDAVSDGISSAFDGIGSWF